MLDSITRLEKNTVNRSFLHRWFTPFYRFDLRA